MQFRIDYSFEKSLDIGGYAALYATEFSKPFKVFGFATVEVTGALYYGSISGGVSINASELSIELTPPSIGVGYSWGVDIDWD